MGTGPVFLEGLECLGTESSLLDCAMEVALGLTICGHSHDSGIRCYGGNNSTVTIYLHTVGLGMFVDMKLSLLCGSRLTMKNVFMKIIIITLW